NETLYNISLTHDKASFTGASDFLMNADLSFTKKRNNESNIMATVMYNHFSDRLYSLGSQGRGNQLAKGVGTLDFIQKYKINRHLGLDLDARNLLDPTNERYQESANGPLTVLSYSRGVRFSFGVKFTL